MLKKSQKIWNQVFARLKKVKKHGFDFLQGLAQKISKSMDLIFYKLREAQKHGLNYLKG